MPRTPNFSSFFAALFAVVLVGAASAEELPSAPALLDAVLAPPTMAYHGRVMVTQWYGKQTRAEEMRVYVLPPDKIRREFLAPDGSVRRVSISDGDVESVHLVRSGKTVMGNAVHSYEKVLPGDLEKEALLANYELLVSTSEKVAGRATWKLTMKPKTEGKPWQSLWVDQSSKVVLRTKRYLPRRPFASEAQFSSFEPLGAHLASMFEVDDATAGIVESRGLAPAFLTLAQLNAATGDPANLPERLPGGFVFESSDVFPIGKNTVRHARYTDGLTVVSLFLTRRPVKLPKGGVIPPGDAHLPGPLRASSAGKLIQWGSGTRHFTLMGDVSRELVAEITKSLR